MPTRLVLEGGEPGTASSWRTERTVSYDEAFKRELRELHACIVEDRESRTSGRDGLRDVALCQAIVSSMLGGGPQPRPTALGGGVRIGLFTDGLGHLSLPDALAWLERELPSVRDLEIGTGGYSPVPHCELRALAGNDDERRRFVDGLESRGFRLAALNASGNPLENAGHDTLLRGTIELAGLLEVERVVCMSGGRPELSGGGWFPGVEDEVERYWQDRVLPYWEAVSALAARHADLRLCFELEPGAAVYNVSTFERVAELGSNLHINLDPSHFFWQSIDPLAVVARLGDRVGFVHGKDTVVDPARLELDGALDRTAWRYATVGHAHGEAWWRTFAAALHDAGYDDVVSIEYEDPLVPAEQSIAEAARLLAEALSPAGAVA